MEASHSFHASTVCISITILLFFTDGKDRSTISMLQKSDSYPFLKGYRSWRIPFFNSWLDAMILKNLFAFLVRICCLLSLSFNLNALLHIGLDGRKRGGGTCWWLLGNCYMENWCLNRSHLSRSQTDMFYPLQERSTGLQRAENPVSALLGAPPQSSCSLPVRLQIFAQRCPSVRFVLSGMARPNSFLRQASKLRLWYKTVTMSSFSYLSIKHTRSFKHLHFSLSSSYEPQRLPQLLAT